jgi:hypothetical protein
VAQPTASEDEPGRPPAHRRRWTSFVTNDTTPGRTARGLHEEANPRHRLRVEHDDHTLLIHLRDEDAGGWTTIAVDRATRRWAAAQGSRQTDTARDAAPAWTSDDPGVPLRVPSDYQRARRLPPRNQVERKASDGHA